MKNKFPGLDKLFVFQNVFSIICFLIGLFSMLEGLLGAGGVEFFFS